MLYYNRGYYDNYFIFQAFKFKLSLVSFLLFLCILAVSVLWLTVIIISLFYIVLIFFYFGYIF